MAFHNPFLKDGLLRFPDNGSVVRHVEKWAKVRGEQACLPIRGLLDRARGR